MSTGSLKIFDWYDAGDVEVRSNPDQAFHVSRASADSLDHSEVRCRVIGRHLFDVVGGWNGRPIVGDRVFVDTQHDDPHVVIAAHRVLHLRYRLRH